jgi:hypothetical protein
LHHGRLSLGFVKYLWWHRRHAPFYDIIAKNNRAVCAVKKQCYAGTLVLLGLTPTFGGGASHHPDDSDRDLFSLWLIVSIQASSISPIWDTESSILDAGIQATRMVTFSFTFDQPDLSHMGVSCSATTPVKGDCFSSIDSLNTRDRPYPPSDMTIRS